MNIGTADRIIVVVIGLSLISLVFICPKTLWGLVGIISLAIAAIPFCPLYRLVRVNTCET